MTPGESWAVFKRRVLLQIEEHPGGTSGDVVLALDTSFDLVLECIDILLSQRAIYWIENPRNVWRYYAHPQPTAWEVLLREDMV